MDRPIGTPTGDGLNGLSGTIPSEVGLLSTLGLGLRRRSTRMGGRQVCVCVRACVCGDFIIIIQQRRSRSTNLMTACAVIIHPSLIRDQKPKSSENNMSHAFPDAFGHVRRNLRRMSARVT